MKIIKKVKKVYHFLLAWLGAVIYGFPSRKMIVFGVTGTKGKTTTADIIFHILKEKGFKPCLISSLKFKIGDKEFENKLKMTMPGRFFIQSFLARALKQGCDSAVLEVTSEGIEQYRHRFLDFDIVVFTNLEPEHIESHGSFENYRKAKTKLFEKCEKSFKKKIKKVGVVNLNDENSEYFLKLNLDYYGFGIEGEEIKVKNEDIKKVIAKQVKNTENGIEFYIDDTKFESSLNGVFNVYNILAGVCAVLPLGIEIEELADIIKRKQEVKGRMEIIEKPPFYAVIDFAHTPRSVELVYKNTVDIFSKKLGFKPRLICILGSAGGGRDKWKRKEFGKLAAKYCDKIILTMEDPADEDPLKIAKEIEKGVLEQNPSADYEIIIDREKAIEKALGFCDGKTVVVSTGKGGETLMWVGPKKKIPWDEKGIFERIIKEKVSAE
ncbi:UDP-N-acetylmuramoyl-L-alanyl-D-glutamate--2, 6-diaminopimelate ligase [bacterium HR34]|nr:UDP-N-acetylmuramoyl-L-alanyl-D-glutamate--2, 6-diaminopimelate ligase [bacterium HR34]